jgi:hypothetical protein
MNIQKTKYLCVEAETSNTELDNGKKIKACKEYKYLGMVFDQQGTDDADIKFKIIQTKYMIGCLNGLFWSKEIDKKEGNIKYLSH